MSKIASETVPVKSKSAEPARAVKSQKSDQATWKNAYDAQIGEDRVIKNRSGIEVKALYTPDDWSDESYDDELGYPGQAPYTRGIYATMHRGRAWTQRQLIGLGTPEEYNERLTKSLDQGASAISLLPCNSGFRGIDCDEAPTALLGTCGTVINSIEDMDAALKGVPLDQISTAVNDPSPFTLFAFLLGVAKRRGIPFDKITGTANQSDYISHFVANHMFYRLSLPGARRVFVDHVAYCREHVPNWNPVSVVGQHMQQAGATPAETMGFTLSTAIQHAEDCINRGMEPDYILPRFTFFFDISISFFEEIAKFRAARRIWARIAQERLGAKDPRSMRFKFHGQTSGVDLTSQQPLNNIARVSAQAIAGILSGLQSMHTDSYDEAISCPTEGPAQIASATQHILREEAHLCDVIDPLGGSYYVETLTDQMEEKILEVMEVIDKAGGMYEAVEQGVVQRMIGKSALAHQQKVERGDEKIIGVNHLADHEDAHEPAPYRPDRSKMERHVTAFKEYKSARNQSDVLRAIDRLTKAADNEDENIFASIVDAADKGATHGEIIARLREDLGFGQPLVVE